MSKHKIVLPGDQVSTSEELLPGEGTFEEEGIIRASRAGIYVVDEKQKKATIKPLTSVPVELKKNDTVLAEVSSVRSNMVIVNVIHLTGVQRAISGETDATLRVSEISNTYIKDPSSEFSPGDVIRAKVTQVKPSLQLITKDRNLGVIKALCGRCRHALVNKGNTLECPNCNNKERRKIADDYGNYDLQKL